MFLLFAHALGSCAGSLSEGRFFSTSARIRLSSSAHLSGFPDLKFAALADKNRRVGNAGVLQQLFAQHDAPGTVQR